MAKLKNPLLSFNARGKLADILAFKRRLSTNIVEKLPFPKDAKSPPQLAWRHMFNKCVDLWHTLSAAEKQAWESAARPHHMTGYAWYISQCLRPNPGIYLPLQGGTMSGDIDMAKNRILKLPSPVDLQEAVRLQEYFTFIWPYLYHEGARVYHNAAQAIPHNTNTVLALNSERYDTDTIHDLITNNSRLTCHKAGKYVISGTIRWETNAGPSRMVAILLNGVTTLARLNIDPRADGFCDQTVTTIYDLALADYLELSVYHFSGAPLNVAVIGNYSPEFMMQRIG